MSSDESTVRDSNFELLRIVLIAMVTGLHYLYFGGALDALKPSDLNFYVAYAFESLFIIAVDCFILITGYYQINGKFKLKRVVDLWMQVIFYSVTISSIFWVFGKELLTTTTLLQTFFPLITGRFWFITLYMVLYLASPFINIALNNMEKETHKKLLIILAVFFVILPSFHPRFTYFKDDGYSLYNFVFLYCTGAYIRKYDLPGKTQLNFLFKYFICSLLILSGVTFLQIIGKSGHMFNYNFIFVELGAICFFMFFKHIKIKSQKINSAATSVFGIYLISTHPFIMNVLFSKILHCADYYYSPLFIPHMLVSLIGVLIVCLIIESFRYRLFIILNNKVWSSLPQTAKQKFDILQQALTI